MKQFSILLLLFSLAVSAKENFVPPVIQSYDTYKEEEEEPCYSYWEIKDTESGFSYFEYILEYSDYYSRIIVEEEKHDGSITKDELLKQKENGESYYTKYLRYIEGFSTLKDNKLHFKSDDGKTTETFTIIYDKDGKIEKLKNESSGAFWLRGQDCHKVSISM